MFISIPPKGVVWSGGPACRGGGAVGDSQRAALGRRAEDSLDLEADGHLVADHDAATLEGHVELDAEVLPADLARGAEPGAGPHRRLDEPVQLEVERHGPGDAVQRELTVEDIVVTAGAQPGGAVGHDRVR